MNSNKSLSWTIALLVVGVIIFLLLPNTPAALSFAIGVIGTLFLFYFSTLFGAANPTSETTSPSTTTTLYVGNLPYRASESHVRELFSQYGDVFAVRLMKDKRTGKRRGFGFVVMASAQSDAAIHALNEQDYMQRTLKVRVANDPKQFDEDTEEVSEQD